MRAIRTATNSLVLALSDLTGIALGALIAFRLLGKANQVWLQLPVAAFGSIALFCLWVGLLRVLKWKRLELTGSTERKFCLIISLLWAPLVFVPLHYVTQGYLSSLGNLLALALYQTPINALALFNPWTAPVHAHKQGRAKKSGNWDAPHRCIDHR